MNTRALIEMLQAHDPSGDMEVVTSREGEGGYRAVAVSSVEFAGKPAFWVGPVPADWAASPPYSNDQAARMEAGR